MMNKISLSADHHFYTRSPLGNKRDTYQWHIFKGMIYYIIHNHHKAHILLGDLFQFPNPPESLREKIYEYLKPLFDASILAAYIAGNHCSSITQPCFAGEAKSELLANDFDIRTGTEIRPMLIPGFDFHQPLYTIPWYASLQPNWWLDYSNCTFFGHVAIIGAEMNEGVACTNGIPLSVLKERNIRIITGHFHKSQDHPNYSYVGGLFRQNFGEADYTPCFAELSEDGTLTRIPVDDWEFITINCPEDSTKVNNNNPTAIKCILNAQKLDKLYEINEQYTLSWLKGLGYTNIQYLKKEVRNTVKKELNNKIDKTVNTKNSFVRYLRTNNFSEQHINSAKKWLAIEETNV